MALTINSNTSSTFAVGQFGEAQRKLTASLERIATGRRINKAADDASGMAIANRLLSQARGTGQAMRNANDAISIAQIADSALSESTSLIQNIREKALQAANASQSQESRQAIQADINRSLAQLDNIAQNTSFGGQKLLSGSFSNKSFQVGANSGETISLSIGSTETAALGLTDINVLTEEGAQNAVALADEALARLDATRGEIGSTQNQLSSTINNLATTQINLLAAESAIADVDIAEETMVFARMKALTEAKSFAMAQAKNVNKQSVLSLLQG